MKKAAHLASGRWIRKEKRYAIYIRDGWRCLYCDRDLAGLADGQEMTLDHLTEQGGNHESNLITCCKSCNTGKAGYSVESFASVSARERIAKTILKPLDLLAGRAFLSENREKLGEFEIPEVFIPSRILAGHLRITDKELFELSKQKIIEPPNEKGYDLFRVLLALFLAKQSDDSGSMDALKLRNLKQKVELDDIKILRESGDLVPVEWAKQLVAHWSISTCHIIKDSGLAEYDKVSIVEKIEGINFENFLSQLRTQVEADLAGEPEKGKAGTGEGQAPGENQSSGMGEAEAGI